MKGVKWCLLAGVTVAVLYCLSGAVQFHTVAPRPAADVNLVPEAKAEIETIARRFNDPTPGKLANPW